MREIKFRAWNPENKTMVAFDNEKAASDMFIAKHLLMLIANKHDLGEDLLMQGTGLLDINGGKIYEGDFLHQLDPVSFSPLRVYFDDGSFLVDVGKFHTIKIDSRYIKTCELVIVGNIHENPELLESSNAKRYRR